MTTRIDIQKEIGSKNVDHCVVSMQMEGVRKLYCTAVHMKDGVKADHYRSEMHELLDKQMDIEARLMQLTNELLSTSQ